MQFNDEPVYRIHVVTDQGNGGAYCSRCGANLTGFVLLGDPPPYPCPDCGAEWIDSPTVGYSLGGSDF